MRTTPKWEGTRSEAFVSDVHSRDTCCDGALALTDDGKIMALQLDYIGNVGAHPVSSAVLSNLLRMAGPPYDVPAMHVKVRGALTNTTPTSVPRCGTTTSHVHSRALNGSRSRGYWT